VGFLTVVILPPGLNELHCSWSIGGISLLILATQETQCVGKSGGISPVKKGTKPIPDASPPPL
jgi:hypothetical protein